MPGIYSDTAQASQYSRTQWTQPPRSFAAAGSRVKMGGLTCVVTASEPEYVYLSPMGVVRSWKFERGWLSYNSMEMP